MINIRKWVMRFFEKEMPVIGNKYYLGWQADPFGYGVKVICQDIKDGYVKFAYILDSGNVAKNSDAMTIEHFREKFMQFNYEKYLSEKE